jgi:hypothetical protein
MGEQIRAVGWRRVGEFGAECCALGREGTDWWLAGTAVATLDGVPAAARYTVRCDAAWRTRAVAVTVSTGLSDRSLRLEVGDDGVWRRDGRPLPELDGCVDVDLGVTPATNTLPIRRLGLAVGAQAEVVAAWVRFPDLSISPLRQRYTRLDADRYRYESGDDADTFRSELEVDDLGLVQRYEGGWVRETTG